MEQLRERYLHKSFTLKEDLHLKPANLQNGTKSITGNEYLVTQGSRISILQEFSGGYGVQVTHLNPTGFVELPIPLSILFLGDDMLDKIEKEISN